ncbi:Zn(II)2Cys6 transcription factor [Fusarium tjaetaba]|uniref:Zn(II)2Cys6 transcription factor n=1 Tax=Fusarium tjaetaba TaxID=1567544 RepID=A0A8H5VH57_9HYPO|nr:Zn(II)2Cys6 transcription factor [Fusarium tjaetaba]KAF5622113.1 Zn(II)2Cys6 transcription factor [Fusarium tjaetaba]
MKTLQDCKTCSLRRIRCDHTTPHCLKCTGRGLSCPGYKRQIRWVNSIASRGKFKGLPAPTLEPATLPSPEAVPSTVQSRHDKLDEPSQEAVDQLIEYFTLELAPKNVWVHSPENGYTRLVVRLAHTQPALRYAIIGLSAAHQSYASASTTSGFSQKAHLKAITLITDQIRTLTSMGNQTLPTGHREATDAVLAATLVVCNHSLLDCSTADAVFHLRATRTLIKSHLTKGTTDNELFTFIANQVASLDIMACTTLFDPDLVRDVVMPRITAVSTSSNSEGTPGSDPEFLEELEDELELARAATYMAVGRTLKPSRDAHLSDTTLLIEAFHQAGLIYACRRLGVGSIGGFEEVHRSKLFRLLEKAITRGSYLPGLSWPILMAGISCHGYHDRIQLVRQLCHDLVRSSPFQYYSNILRFLEEFWESSDDDWILVARAWENRGEPLLAM